MSPNNGPTSSAQYLALREAHTALQQSPAQEDLRQKFAQAAIDVFLYHKEDVVHLLNPEELEKKKISLLKYLQQYLAEKVSRNEPIELQNFSDPEKLSDWVQKYAEFESKQASSSYYESRNMGASDFAKPTPARSTKVTLDPTKQDAAYPCPLEDYFVLIPGSDIDENGSLKYSIDRAKIRALRVQDQGGRDVPQGSVEIDFLTTPPHINVDHSKLPSDITSLTVTVPIQIKGKYQIRDIGLIDFVQETTIAFQLEFTAVEETWIRKEIGSDTTKELLLSHMKGWGYDEKHIEQCLTTTKFHDELLRAYQLDETKLSAGRTVGSFAQKVLHYAQSTGEVKKVFETIKKTLQMVKEQMDIKNSATGVYNLTPSPLETSGVIPGRGEKRISLVLKDRFFSVTHGSDLSIDHAKDDLALQHLRKVTLLNGTPLPTDCRRIESGEPPILVINQDSPNLPPVIDGILIELPTTFEMTYTSAEYGNFTTTFQQSVQETIKFADLDDAYVSAELVKTGPKDLLKKKLLGLGRDEDQVLTLLSSTSLLRDIISAFKEDYKELVKKEKLNDSFETLFSRLLSNNGGKMSLIFEELKKNHTTMNNQVNIVTKDGGIYQRDASIPPLEQTGIDVGAGLKVMPLKIDDRVFAMAPTSQLTIHSILTDPLRTHMIKVTTLHGDPLDSTCWTIDWVGNSPRLILDQDSAALPLVLDGIKLELPMNIEMIYTGGSYGSVPVIINHMLQDTIMFTSASDTVVESWLVNPENMSHLRTILSGYGLTDDQVTDLLGSANFYRDVRGALQEDYATSIKGKRTLPASPVDLFKQMTGNSGGKLPLLLEAFHRVFKEFTQQTDCTKKGDFYQIPGTPFTTPLIPSLGNQDFAVSLSDHFFYRTPGAKIALAGLSLEYNSILADQLECVDQAGKVLTNTPPVYSVRSTPGGIQISVDHSRVPEGTTSLKFRIPVSIGGDFIHPQYGNIPFEKQETIEQTINFKGIPSATFNHYFSDSVDGALAMRMIQLHPEKLVDQCIDQANGLFAGKLPGALSREDAEMVERCFTHQIDDFPSIGHHHAALSSDASIIELLVYEALLERSQNVNEIKDVQSLLEEIQQDPKKLFDSLTILQRAYALYNEYMRVVYVPTRTRLPVRYGRLPEPARTTTGRGIRNRLSRKVDQQLFGEVIPPNDYPSYAFLKGKGDEHGDVKEVEDQKLRGTGVSYEKVKYMINIQHVGSVDFDLTIPEQAGRPEYVFNGNPGEVADIRHQLEHDFSYPLGTPDRRLQYTVQLLFEKELAIRLSKQLGLLGATYGGNTYILEIEGDNPNQELVLRRRGPGPRTGRETWRFRDLDTDTDRDEFVDMIQEVMDNSVNQHRSLMLANTTDTTVQTDYLHACDHFPNYKDIEGSLGFMGMRWGTPLEFEGDEWTFGPDKLTISYKNGQFVVRDEKNTYEKSYKNMGQLLLDSKAQSYALDFMTKFHEKYLEYMSEARQIDQRHTYLVEDPLSGYMFGIQNINGRLTFGCVSSHTTRATFRNLREVIGRASLWTEYDNDFVCDAPITFDKHSEEVAKSAIFGRRELYYPLLQSIMKNSKGTNADAKYRREKIKDATTTATDVGKQIGNDLFESFMQGFRK